MKLYLKLAKWALNRAARFAVMYHDQEKVIRIMQIEKEVDTV